MSQLPRTEVVNFVAVQAYRYSPLRVPGYGGTLEPYVVPSANGPPTALVCYAAQGSDTDIRECEQIVATLTVFGYSGYDLTPKPGYASRLGPLVGALDSERMTLRREMGQRRTAAATAGLAASLADRFATAAASLRTIQAPVAARAAQAALVDAMERTGRSYRALGSAVGAEGSGGLAVTQPQVAEAELGLDRALETFALLGYKHA